jgi:hypothetical protein
VFGQLYVTYVGPGGGLVNVFNTNGDFVKRFATGGTLNAPWGITNVHRMYLDWDKPSLLEISAMVDYCV